MKQNFVARVRTSTFAVSAPLLTWSSCSDHFRTTALSPNRSINRYYDPTTDSFISVDPDLQSTDQVYVFTNDNPLNATDPLGLCSEYVPLLCPIPTTSKKGLKPTSKPMAGTNSGSGAAQVSSTFGTVGNMLQISGFGNAANGLQFLAGGAQIIGDSNQGDGTGETLGRTLGGATLGPVGLQAGLVVGFAAGTAVCGDPLCGVIAEVPGGLIGATIFTDIGQSLGGSIGKGLETGWKRVVSWLF